ncbi:hypothetical protein CYLTODRAFT_425266 [Cylindrobasidium torrendii FP15055 ss-10]|uniref:Uncharacterized protein n=1 Tax=Cylindrobasidium torrendii FP15055 ss-10 TaxID=1314674 RepID=A0A0D7B2D8_9AGAR|nr:hypothetical protein CYLTODRAFT_425266 [Cylindrobasidium torrendii FP15055 ss-10]
MSMSLPIIPNLRPPSLRYHPRGQESNLLLRLTRKSPKMSKVPNVKHLPRFNSFLYPRPFQYDLHIFSQVLGTTLPSSTSHSHQALKSEVDALKARNNELQSQLARFQTNVETIHRHNVELLRNNENFNSELAYLRRLYEEERVHRTTAEEQNEVRRDELHQAQVYLEMPDTISGADVVQLAISLNTEVFQFSASISEASSRREVHKLTADDLSTLRNLVGANLVDILHRANTEPDNDTDAEFLLQASLQTVLTNNTRQWTTLFDLNGSERSKNLFASVYHNIYCTSPQSVSARWRALVYSRHKYADPMDARQILFHELEKTTTTVLCALGYKSSDQLTSGLPAIADAIIKLDRAMGEASLSQNLSVISIEPGTRFDASSMDNTDSGPARDGTVVCCTDLGIMCAERRDTSRPPVTGLLRKPGVLLDSAFDL